MKPQPYQSLCLFSRCSLHFWEFKPCCSSVYSCGPRLARRLPLPGTIGVSPRLFYRDALVKSPPAGCRENTKKKERYWSRGADLAGLVQEQGLPDVLNLGYCALQVKSLR